MTRLNALRKLFLPVLAFVGGLWIAGLFLGSHDETSSVRPLPLVLNKIQALGDLHTVRHEYENVFEYETHRKPQGWVAHLPGAASLVKNGTRNKALLSAHGSVEAGVDLRLAEAFYEGETLVVQLPKAKLYEPNVDAKVHRSAPGMFWTDENIALKAVRSAKERITAASMKQGILEEAATEAEKRIRELLQDVAGGVEVRFEQS